MRPAGGVSDSHRGAVSVDERRPDSPAVEQAVPVKLSPLQRAWAAYRDHTAGCEVCRSMDGDRCETALQLWQAHQDLCDAAYSELVARRHI